MKIGPILQVFDRDRYVPNMMDAYNTDFEMGDHYWTNQESERFHKRYPTIVAMSELIEKERDQLRKENNTLRKKLKQQKGKKE